MKEETINLVLRTADDMGYYKAKNQKLRQSIPTVRMVALFQQESHNMGAMTYGILEGIRKEVIEQQRNMRLEYETISVEDNNFRDRIEKGNIDVAILVGKMDSEILTFLDNHIPYMIYSGLDSIIGYDEIICDSREGIRKGVAFLANRGMRRIAYVGPVRTGTEYKYMGYIEGLTDNGLTRDENLIENSDLSTSSGYEAAKTLLARMVPDAIIAANDNVAIGVLRALKEKGITCPEDTALIGFDNLDTSAYLEPSLSTFDVPRKELGRFAVKIAIDRVENPREDSIRITLPYTFIERESTFKMMM